MVIKMVPPLKLTEEKLCFFSPSSVEQAQIFPIALQKQIFEYSPTSPEPAQIGSIHFRRLPLPKCQKSVGFGAAPRAGAPHHPPWPCPPSALSADTESAPGPPPFSSATLLLWGAGEARPTQALGLNPGLRLSPDRLWCHRRKVTDSEDEIIERRGKKQQQQMKTMCRVSGWSLLLWRNVWKKVFYIWLWKKSNGVWNIWSQTPRAVKKTQRHKKHDTNGINSTDDHESSLP